MARICNKIELAEPFTFKPCAIGEPADYAGMRIVAYYNDGTRDILDVTQKMYNESDLHATGKERRGVVVYEGKKLQVSVPLLDCYLERIEVESKHAPIYQEGEKLHHSEFIVRAFYSDHTNRIIRNYKIFPFEALTTAYKEISFKYGRSKAVLPIRVVSKEGLEEEQKKDTLQASEQPEMEERKEQVQNPDAANAGKTIKGISIAKTPNRIRYLVGDRQADLTGGRLDLIYSDGTVGQIDMNADDYIELKADKPGTGKISFSCLGVPVAFPVEVLNPEVMDIQILEQPYRLDYVDGDVLDLTGLILEIEYNDRTRRRVTGLTSNGFVVNLGMNKTGATLAFGNVPFTIPVKVEKEKVEIIPVKASLSKEPKKKRYVERECEKPDLTGAEFMVEMSDGLREFMTPTDDMVSGFDISKPGRKSYQIQFGAIEATVEIEVRPRSLTKLEIAAAPKKTTYKDGESIQLQGLVLYAVYDNKEKEVVSDYEVDKLIASQGDTALVFSYRGKMVSCPIMVEEQSVVNLVWEQVPNQNEYMVGAKTLLCAGGKLRATYQDGHTQVISLTPDMVETFDSTRSGVQNVKISYRGCQIQLPILVKEPLLLGLMITEQPKTMYQEGECFDATGMVVHAQYNDGSSKEVTVKWMPNGPLSIGTETMMIIHQDKAVLLNITVVPKQPEPDERTAEPDGAHEKEPKEYHQDIIPEPMVEEPEIKTIETRDEAEPESESIVDENIEETLLEEPEIEKEPENNIAEHMEFQNQIPAAAEEIPEPETEEEPVKKENEPEQMSEVNGSSENQTKAETNRAEKTEKPVREIHPFYPSTFSIRFQESPKKEDFSF